MRTLATMVQNRLLFFLAISQVSQNVGHFEILTLESMGNLKCGLSQKWLIVEPHGRKFETWGTAVHISRLLVMLDSLSLVWGHSVQISNFRFL